MTTSEETRARVVTLPWGRATVEEEVAVAGGGGTERAVEVGVARLRLHDGDEQLLRFFYRVDGRVMRGPLTLRPSELAALAERLRESPELQRLVRALGTPARGRATA
jgi:hypothetical protein